MAACQLAFSFLNARYPLMPGNMAHAASFDFPVRYKVVDLPTGWWQDLNEEKYQTFIGAAKEIFPPAAGRGRSSNYHRLRIIRGLAGAGSRGVGHSHMHLSPADGAHAFQNHREAEKSWELSPLPAAVSKNHIFLDASGIDENMPFCDRGTGHLFRIHGLHPLSEEDGNGYSPLSAAGGTDCKRYDRQRPCHRRFLLECSDIPPFAAAISEETGLPVFDFIAMADLMYRALVPRTY